MKTKLSGRIYKSIKWVICQRENSCNWVECVSSKKKKKLGWMMMINAILVDTFRTVMDVMQ